MGTSGQIRARRSPNFQSLIEQVLSFKMSPHLSGSSFVSDMSAIDVSCSCSAEDRRISRRTRDYPCKKSIGFPFEKPPLKIGFPHFFCMFGLSENTQRASFTFLLSNA